MLHDEPLYADEVVNETILCIRGKKRSGVQGEGDV
jgi:hypothetical protein